ncbi:MAG: SMC-Scp complex subunit ScpB [Opitutaceae bacterium]|nr:SMC-Scp complex subunit ScpB [Opitutaceae bacterium]
MLRALLFSSSQPLSVKDIQNLFARFHEQAPPPRLAAATDTPAPDADAADATDESTAATAEAPALDESNTAPDAADTSAADAPDDDADTPADATADTPATPADTALDTAAALDTPAASSFAPASSASADTPSSSSSEPAEEPDADTPDEEHDAELYEEVPSLITGAQIREAMDSIAEELRAAADLYLLIEGPSGYRIVTHPRYARWIRILRDEPPPVKLTQSAIETLAIIAYRQPATRTDIESIRGVSAEAGLNKLIERELVYIMGRADLPGRPLQYGTTDKFLDFVGVKSLVELPASDVLSPRQIDEWLKNAANTRPPADADMGLPLEEGEGESPNLNPVTVDPIEPPAEDNDTPPPAPPDTAADDDTDTATDTDIGTDTDMNTVATDDNDRETGLNHGDTEDTEP